MADAVAALPGQVPLVVQEEKITLDLLRGDLCRTAVIVECEPRDKTQIRTLGVLGASSDGHVVYHLLTQRCHVSLPLTYERSRRTPAPVRAGTSPSDCNDSRKNRN